MIERYQGKYTSEIWSDIYKVKLWYKIEQIHLNNLIQFGIIPKFSNPLNEYFEINQSFIDLIHHNEIETKHEIAAFLKTVTDLIDDVNIKYLHYGLTSSDVLDTCLSLQIKESCQVVIDLIDKNMLSLQNLAYTYQYIWMNGRTHGMVAQPMPVGIIFVRLFQAFKTSKNDFELIQYTIPGKFSGAIGLYGKFPIELEYQNNKDLGLNEFILSSQVIPRYIYSDVIYSLSKLASIIEQFATTIRHLQRTEINEIREPFDKSQIGSSAMAHKKNPIISENLCGCARMIRSYLYPAMENINLWHERDISHSSTERIIFPDAFNLMEYMLSKTLYLLENISIDINTIETNTLTNLGSMLSEYSMNKKILEGKDRWIAYEEVKKEFIPYSLFNEYKQSLPIGELYNKIFK